MLASAQGKNLNRYVPDYVLFDLETTGISCNCDEVIEISAVKVRSGTIVDSFSSLVNPGRPIPWGASRDCRTRFGLVPGNDYVDTLRFARCRLAGLPTYRLTALAEHYGLPTMGAHRALNDCRMNQQVFELLAREPEAESAPEKLCPLCGAPLAKRRGRFGAFYGCTGYPQCRYTENIL